MRTQRDGRLMLNIHSEHRLSVFLSPDGTRRRFGRNTRPGISGMAEPWSPYRQVVVETYCAMKAGKSSRIRVRPVKGQPFPPTMDVECSRSMRMLYPAGTRFCI